MCKPNYSQIRVQLVSIIIVVMILEVPIWAQYLALGPGHSWFLTFTVILWDRWFCTYFIDKETDSEKLNYLPKCTQFSKWLSHDFN